MNGNANSQIARSLNPPEKRVCETTNSPEVKEKRTDSEQHSQNAQSLGERVRTEVRNRLGCVGDELFDDDDDAEVEILEEEEVIRGTRGLGALWKLSLTATVSFAAYMLFSGSRIEPRWIPNITERERIPRIYRPRNKPSSSSSASR